jgi:hypothetical protein
VVSTGRRTPLPLPQPPLAGKGRICFAGKAESERVTIDREEWRRRRGTGFRALVVVSYTYTVGAWIYAWLQGASLQDNFP